MAKEILREKSIFLNSLDIEPNDLEMFEIKPIFGNRANFKILLKKCNIVKKRERICLS
jgi:hypothetical protein